MKQIYIVSFLLAGFLFFVSPVSAQETQETEGPDRKEISIEGLSIYPNPVLGDKIYISTKHDKDKRVEVFNVLGKPVLRVLIAGNELDISSLEKGIYFLKIVEDKKTSTRKLVIR